MNFVIPMAGRGQRFVDAGFDLPKMLIKAKGKTLLEWSIDSLPLSLCTNLICIILREHEEQYQLSEKIKSIYGTSLNLKFFVLDHITRGQAETVWLARSLFDQQLDLVIFNIDTYFHSDTLTKALQRKDIDGVLGSFNSNQSRFSFARLNEDDYIVETTEKVAISNNALTGLYHFKNTSDFEDTVSFHLENNIRVNNEFYIAPMYNYLIKKGRKFIIDKVNEFDILGTPEELKLFLEKP